MVQRGDKVVYIQRPERVMTAISDPELFWGGLVVTCKWLPRGKKDRCDNYEYHIFAVKVLRRVEDDGKTNPGCDMRRTHDVV